MLRRLLCLLTFSIVLSGCQPKSATTATPSITPTAQIAQTEVTPTPEQLKLENLLETVKGSLTVKSGSKTITLTAPETSPLVEGDLITTKSDSLAVVYYHEDSYIRLAPDTVLTYSDTEDTTTKAKQSQGTIYVRFKKVLGVQENFELETPTAVATVRGTGFINRILPSNKGRLIVTESQVILKKLDKKTGKAKEGTDQPVDAGNQADLDATDKPAKIVPHKPDVYEKIWEKYNQDADKLPTHLKEIIVQSLERIECATCSASIKRKLLARHLSENNLASISGRFGKDIATISGLPRRSFNEGGPPISSLPNTEGFTSGLVKGDIAPYALSCVSARKSAVKVITDSADDNDCRNDCKVKPLSEFASQNQALAAMNGMYFCPAEYPACVDKKNSFDTLLFNYRLKKYINSDNNVYSVLPFVVFRDDGSVRFLQKTLEWGRDTGITGAIAGSPLLVWQGQAVTSDSQLDEKQRNARYGAGAIVEKGEFIYMCYLRGANILETSKIYAGLGADYAINIDGGGSAAIWYNGGYKLGPGRNIPNAIMFVRK